MGERERGLRVVLSQGRAWDTGPFTYTTGSTKGSSGGWRQVYICCSSPSLTH